jgi:hypothetical protein
MASELIVAVEIISAIATVSVFYSTLKPCSSSGVSFLLGVPIGFGLLAIAFVTNALASVAGFFSSQTGLLEIIYLLTQTYGMIFLALTFARRTALRFVGESTSIELVTAGLITIILLAYVVISGPSPSSTPVQGGVSLLLRTATAVAAFYLVYEASRNWQFTKKASEGFAIVGFALLLIEQLGFILSQVGIGVVGVFLGYEGRMLGLFVLNAATYVGIQRGNYFLVLKRLGLAAPAH